MIRSDARPPSSQCACCKVCDVPHAELDHGAWTARSRDSPHQGHARTMAETTKAAQSSPRSRMLQELPRAPG
jgi:hypothetical protein